MPNPSQDGATDLRRSKRQQGAPSRLPPSSPESEQAILGCCLLDNACIGSVIEAFKGSVECLYDLRNQTILEHMISIFEDREPVEVITLQYRLKAFGLLEQVGGIAYLSSLEDTTPSAANLDYYIGIVRDCYLRRRMIKTATDVVSSMFELPAGDLDEALDMAERAILQVSESRVQAQQETIRTIVQQAMGEIERSLENRGEPSGMSTGFVDFDKMTDGLHAGEMIVIAARPSVGKTSLAMNIAEFVAVTQRISVGIFSLEMTKVELMKRMVCSRARVNIRNIRDGYSSDADFAKLTTAAGQIMASPMSIDDEGGISILQLRAKARRMWQQFGIKLFVIDYLQLLHGLKAESRQLEVSQVSSGIKNLAKELGVPILVAAQLNRDIEKEKNRRPRLSDLRESGSIENDSDVVTFLYRPGEDKEPDPTEDAFPVNWFIGKNRNGPTGIVSLVFRRSLTRFELGAKVADEDVPEQQQEFKQ